MFGFVAKHRGVWPVSWICDALGVSRSGFHAWMIRPQSERSMKDQRLGAVVRASFVRSDRTYGARRVWHDVLAEGFACGLHGIERLMQLMMAIWRRGRPKELLHHSDQGSQYTSEPFQRLMADNGVTCSMSRSGNVWDNAAAESFFSSLKIERVRRKVYRTRDQARADVFDYIERFYNPTRRHSTNGYLSPMQYEERAMKA